MRDNDLFQLALGITSPWFVASSAFDGAKKRLDIQLDFKSGRIAQLGVWTFFCGEVTRRCFSM